MSKTAHLNDGATDVIEEVFDFYESKNLPAPSQGKIIQKALEYYLEDILKPKLDPEEKPDD